MYIQLLIAGKNISGISMTKQKEKLDHVFENWKGNSEQIDDVLIIGIKF